MFKISTNDELISALKNNNLDQVNKLLAKIEPKQGFEGLVIKDKDGREHCEALQLAVEKGHLDIVKSLLKIDSLKASTHSIAEVYALSNQQLENVKDETYQSYKGIRNYLNQTCTDIERRQQNEDELKKALELSGIALEYEGPIDNLIKEKIKSNTLISEDADGIKHCYILELAIQQDNTKLTKHLLETKAVSAGAEAALSILPKKESSDAKKELMNLCPI